MVRAQWMLASAGLSFTAFPSSPIRAQSDSPMESADSSSSDNTSPRPRGRLLQQDRAEIERLEQTNFNKSLRINSLEELVLLLQNGEGFTEESVLRELTQLQAALKAREDELHRQTEFWIQTVDELRAQLQQAKATTTDRQDRADGVDTKPASVAPQRDCEEKVKLQAQLDSLIREKQEQKEEIGCLQRQNTKLSSHFEDQGRAMRDLKRDLERAMDTIYELETHAKLHRSQRDSQTEEEMTLQENEKRRANRCEELRVRNSSEVNALQVEIKALKTRSGEVEKELLRASHDVEILREHKASCEELHCDFHDLRESNRLLFEEVQGHRRSAEQAQKQCKRVELENKDLLKATSVYKSAIADRDDDIRKYMTMLEKYMLKLQQRRLFQQVEENLKQQLADTKALVVAASQRLEGSSIGGDASEHQVDSYIRQIELATSRWGELLAQSQHLQEKLDERLSHGGDGPTKPRWVDDAKRQFSNLRADMMSLSRAMHRLVDNLADLLRQDHTRGAANTDINKPNLSASALRSLNVMHGRRFADLSKKLDELKIELQHQHNAA